MKLAKDYLEIKVAQAPISKVLVTNSNIQIKTGSKNVKVLKTFKFENERFINRFVSFPAYINELVSKDSDNMTYFLTGVNCSNTFIPSEDDYDNFGDDDYYTRMHQNLRSDQEIIFMDYISDEYAVVLTSCIYNLSKQYTLQIIESDMITKIIEESEYEEEEADYYDLLEDIGRIKLYKPRLRLSVVFSKLDIVYKAPKKNINYQNIYITDKADKLFNNKMDNEILVDANLKTGIIVTKNK